MKQNKKKIRDVRSLPKNLKFQQTSDELDLTCHKYRSQSLSKFTKTTTANAPVPQLSGCEHLEHHSGYCMFHKRRHCVCHCQLRFWSRSLMQLWSGKKKKQPSITQVILCLDRSRHVSISLAWRQRSRNTSVCRFQSLYTDALFRFISVSRSECVVEEETYNV